MSLMHTIASMRNLALHLSALEAWPPRDLAIGDLIAFPCSEPAALHDLRSHGA